MSGVDTGFSYHLGSTGSIRVGDKVRLDGTDYKFEVAKSPAAQEKGRVGVVAPVVSETGSTIWVLPTQLVFVSRSKVRIPGTYLRHPEGYRFFKLKPSESWMVLRDDGTWETSTTDLLLARLPAFKETMER